MTSNFWKLNPGDWKDSHPLGKSVENFILENCQYLLYMRRDSRFPCVTCYDASSKDQTFGDPNCTKCWGMGIKTDFMIVPARISYGKATIGPMEGDVRLQPGYVSRGFLSIDFPRGVYPKLEDLAAVCEWDKSTKELGQYPTARVVKFGDTYIIRDINPHFEREISWFQCGSEAYELQDGLLQRLLPRLSTVTIFPESRLWSTKKFW